MRNRIVYSQNFLKNRRLIRELIEKSSITDKDVVIEIGAGQGIITQELVKRSKKVIAIELDRALYEKLSLKFRSIENLELIWCDFISYQLPNFEYKIFSNIPYNITSAIIKKLTITENPARDIYIIIQKEATAKFAGKPYDDKNSQMAILLKPFFQLEIVHKFNRSDFYPRPRVDCVLFRIRKLDSPLVNYDSKKEFEDFVVYTFNQTHPNIIEGLSRVFGKQAMLLLASKFAFSPTAKPSELGLDHWLGLFNYFSNKLDAKHRKIVDGASEKLYKQQQKLKKIHRTRIAKNWKKY